MQKTFDIIVPTYNNLNELKQCLRGFEDQTFKDFRVLICVDGSTDGTIEYLGSAKYEFEFDVLIHPDNFHKGRNETRNLSLSIISAKYILFFDSDIIAQNDLLQRHLDLLEQKDCISVGEIVYQNSNENLWADYLQTRGKGKYIDQAEIPGYYLNTQNVAFKLKYFLELEGQDPELSKNYGGDDTILGYTIEKELNIPFYYNKSAVGYSHLDKTLEKALKQMREFGAVNLKIIRRKYPDFKQIFRFDIAESSLLHHKLLRIFMRDRVAKFLQSCLNFLPRPLKIKIVHYLVFNSIYQGFKTDTY